MGFFSSKKKEPRKTHGSARQMSNEREKELKESYRKGCLRLPSGFPFNDNGHAITVAPTRSGKGTRQLIPSLLFGDSNSIVVIDPKGENAAITRRFRSERSDVFLFNPWNLHDLRCDAINPFDLLDPEDPHVVDDIDLVAELIVPIEKGEQGHWSDRARQMIGGLMLYLIFHEPEENRHPLTLRSLLRQSQDDWQAMITFMQNSSKAGGLVAEAGNELDGYGEREFASVRSTAQRATDVFKGPAMQRALTSSDVDITRLAKDQISIYLMIPADKLSTHNRVTRLLIGLLMKTPIRHRGDRRVVFYLDEFASLGYLEIAETAFAQYAGFGVTLWPFVQDISQLKRHYKDGWQSLIANAEWSIFSANNDQATCELVSKLSGQYTVSSQTSGRNGKSYSETGRALLTPDEVRRAEDIGVIMFKRGENMIYNEALTYWQMDWGRERADRNPFIPKEKDKVLQDAGKKSDGWSFSNPLANLSKWPFVLALLGATAFGIFAAVDPNVGRITWTATEEFLIYGGGALVVLLMIALPIAIGLRLIANILSNLPLRQWRRIAFGWPAKGAGAVGVGYVLWQIFSATLNRGIWVLSSISLSWMATTIALTVAIAWPVLIAVRLFVERDQ
jgi:type IV secretion system protein VirD4